MIYPVVIISRGYKRPQKGVQNFQKKFGQITLFIILLLKYSNFTLYLSVISFQKPLGIYFTLMKKKLVFYCRPMRNEILKNKNFYLITFWYIGVSLYFFTKMLGLDKTKVDSNKKIVEWGLEAIFFNSFC